jgi:hypothetical protein
MEFLFGKPGFARARSHQVALRVTTTRVRSAASSGRLRSSPSRVETIEGSFEKERLSPERTTALPVNATGKRRERGSSSVCAS